MHSYDPEGHALGPGRAAAAGAPELVVTEVPWRTGWRCREPRVHAERARYSVILKAEPIALFSRRTIRSKSKLNGVACEKGYKNNRGCSEGQQCRRQEPVAEQ